MAGAIFYPDTPTHFVSTSEERVFLALQKTLPTGCLVFSNVLWLMKKEKCERPGEREADFVILHRKHGLLVLEVKGGRLKNDRGQFFRVLDSGASYRIKSPVMQAKNNCHQLIDYLHTQLGVPKMFPAGYGLVFPESPSVTSGFGMSMPREIVCFEQDLPNLGSQVFEMMKYWNPGELASNSKHDIDKIAEHFIPLCTSEPLLGDIVPEQEKIFATLTKDQNKIVRLLADVPQALITGGAGTGKTFLALEKARQLCRQGKKVILTCFNRPLAEMLEEQCKNTEIEVYNYHRLCWLRAQAIGSLWHGRKELPDPDGPDAFKSDSRYFQSWLPRALAASVKMGIEKYDAVIVDEAQDFDQDWLKGLRGLLRDSQQGVFYVFYDDNQNLWHPNDLPPTGFPVFRLGDNLRNARPIFNTFRPLYSGISLESGGPEFGKVEMIVLPQWSPEYLQKELGRLLHRLVEHEKVAVTDIAVLTGVSTRHSKARDIAELAEQTILFSSVMRFKGLERPVVILIEMDPWFDESIRQSYAKMFVKLPDYERLSRSMLYVALSRARSHLFVIGGKSLCAQLPGISTVEKEETEIC